MDPGSTRSYRFGTKNNWRRRIQNEAFRRVGGRYRTDPILYLAGSEDIDREVAIGKGVPAQNMIGIDRCRVNADRIRARGYPCLYGEAGDILEAWPEGRPRPVRPRRPGPAPTQAGGRG